MGLPTLAPALRDAYDLSLSGVGVVLAAEWIGLTLTLLPWGFAVDRIGERIALGVGLLACAASLVGAAFAPTALVLGLFLGLAGATGGSVQSASGRAVMHWFSPRERGFAFGIRQTAVPIGGLFGALVLPAVAAASGGVRAALLVLAVECALAAAVGVAVIREAPAVQHEHELEQVESVMRDQRLWLLCAGSGLYVATQVAIVSFLVLFFHDERGLSDARAGLVLAAVMIVAGALRLAVGRWSDAVRSRIVPLRVIGLATFAAAAASAATLYAPLSVTIALFVAAGALAAAWNGLSFAAAAELAGSARSGAALGLQQMVLSIVGVAVPPLFAAGVTATSWRAAFGAAALAPLAGWAVLGANPLSSRRPAAGTRTG